MSSRGLRDGQAYEIMNGLLRLARLMRASMRCDDFRDAIYEAADKLDAAEHLLECRIVLGEVEESLAAIYGDDWKGTGSTT